MRFKGFILKHNDFFIYCIFGALATLVNMGSYALFYSKLGFQNTIATAIAWFLAVTFAFFTNKFLVYKSYSFKVLKVIRELCSFYLFRLFTGVVDIVFMYFTVDVFKFNPIVCKFISNLIVGVMNFLAGKLFIFKNHKENEKR